MPLHRRVSDRLRPWYLLDVLAFLFGASSTLWRAADGFGELAVLTPLAAVTAVASGLFAVVVLRFTVGNLWAYAVEYANAGGQWSDLAFLVPVCGSAAAVLVTYAANSNFWAAAWAGFWIFAALAAVVAVVVSFASGYADAPS